MTVALLAPPGLPADLRDADARDLHFALDRVNADYALALDEDEIERWPDFFAAESCIYRVIPRENHEAGYPISIMYCASRGMMLDRIAHIRETAMFAPRRYRHIVGNVRILGVERATLRAQANYAVFETTFDQKTQIYNVGKYVDELALANGALKFRERLCVFDSSVIPTSLIYPI
jgi:3-phenylpropionate/cinnamic acid dioxygenase small subunit